MGNESVRVRYTISGTCVAKSGVMVMDDHSFLKALDWSKWTPWREIK
jgi:hypothetical protein